MISVYLLLDSLNEQATKAKKQKKVAGIKFNAQRQKYHIISISCRVLRAIFQITKSRDWMYFIQSRLFSKV